MNAKLIAIAEYNVTYLFTDNWRQAEACLMLFVGGGWGERPRPRSAAAIHSVTRGWNTQPSNWEAIALMLD